MMLRLVHSAKEKSYAQDLLSKVISNSLKSQGVLNVGFKGGNVYRDIFSQGDDALWAAISKSPDKSKIPKFWNAFGIFLSDKNTQHISVEINIPSSDNSWRVAGAFATDDETGEIYLMHDGAVGGGRPGIGQNTFLRWATMRTVEVLYDDGRIREMLPIGNLADAGFVSRLARYVRKVADFKHIVSEGILDTNTLSSEIEKSESYDKEFSGTKKGQRKGTFAYETYHGEIVDMVVTQRKLKARSTEKVFNTSLIDCYVRESGRITEVYEIKTGVGRQQLYTAIGQLVTHAAPSSATKFLVLPAEEEIPQGFDRAIDSLHIEVRRFKLSGTKAKRVIEMTL